MRARRPRSQVCYQPLETGQVLGAQFRALFLQPHERHLGIATGAGPFLEPGERPPVPLRDHASEQPLPGAQGAPQPPDRDPEVVEALGVLRVDAARRGLARLGHELLHDQTHSLFPVPAQ